MVQRNRNYRGYVILAVIFAAFTVVAFAVPFRRGAVFYLSYVFTAVACAVQLYVFSLAFRRGEGVRSKFYGFPIARLGVWYLGIQLVLGLLCMALGAFVPVWLALVLQVLLLAAAAVGVVAADAMREEVVRQDRKLEKDVAAMRALQSKAAALAGRGSGSPAADALAQLAEDLRYSDPVSAPALEETERELAACIDRLEQALAAGDGESVRALCARAGAVLAERNRLCKLHKNH